MKCLLVICDGMADRPLKSLGGKTPLEKAKTPNLDALSKSGINGIVDTIAPGIRPGSDTAHLSILGYDPLKAYTGRGPFEAAGAGIEVKAGEVAFRTNFATVDEAGVVLDRRAGRISEGTAELAKAINNIQIPGLNFRFQVSTGHRGALVLSGAEFGEGVTESDPHKEGINALKVEALDDSGPSKRTAEALNSFIMESHKVLESHPINLKRIEDKKNPANTLLLRGAGKAPSLIPFREKYGLRGGVISTVALVRGVGSFCGLDVLGAEPSSTTNSLGKMALDSMADYDFVMLNIKKADDASHDGDTQRKIETIEEIDSLIAGFHDLTRENYLALLSDHTSTISRKDHSGDPVPLIIAGPEVRTDEVVTFSERSAASGGLCRIRGVDIMNILIDLMNLSQKFGA
jgi:2,3-bisphosphoglycerate-independent phosphoglycerate mutase